MDYFKTLSFTESLEVYNSLEKKISNELNKDFVIEVLKSVLGAKEKTTSTTNNKVSKLDRDIDGYF